MSAKTEDRVATEPVLNQLLTDEMAVHLEQLADQYAEQYRANKPFPHIVIDNFLPEQVLDAVLREFPDPERLRWIRHSSQDENKLAFNTVEKLPAVTRDTLYFLNTAVTLQFLVRLTGIKGLLPDPYYLGGGLHQIVPGGFLEVHADFNKHETGLDRRLNLLIYLNKDWEEEYGGHLELWDRPMKHCVQKILPVFNRCVIFSTTDFAYHGHPTPLTCPPGQTRKSMALYYYTLGRPDEEVSHDHSTLFQTRPGEEAKGIKRVLRKVALDVMPPFIMHSWGRWRSRRKG